MWSFFIHKDRVVLKLWAFYLPKDMSSFHLKKDLVLTSDSQSFLCGRWTSCPIWTRGSQASSEIHLPMDSLDHFRRISWRDKLLLFFSLHTLPEQWVPPGHLFSRCATSLVYTFSTFYCVDVWVWWHQRMPASDDPSGSKYLVTLLLLDLFFFFKPHVRDFLCY